MTKRIESTLDNAIREATLYAGKVLVLDLKVGSVFARYPERTLLRDIILWRPCDGKLDRDLLLTEIQKVDK